MKIWPALLKVFGLLAVSFSSNYVSGFDDLASSPSPVSGPSCDFTNNARCQYGATCVAPKQCTCENGKGEDGSFWCAEKSDEQHIELTGSNNTLQPWRNGLDAPFHLACRYRITEFTVHKPSENRKCTFQVFGENGVIKGRVMVVAAEFHFKVEENGALKYQKGLKVSAEGNQPETQYVERSKSTYELERPETFTDLPDESDLINSGSGMGEFFDEEDMGPEMMTAGLSDDEDIQEQNQWSSPIPFGTVTDDGMVNSDVDTNHVAKLSVDECGCEFRFRAGSEDLMNDGLGPGLAVSVWDKGEIVFEDADTYIAGHPESDLNHGLRTSMSAAEIILHVALTNSAAQSENRAGELCRDASFVYRSYCKNEADKVKAMSACSLLMTNNVIYECLEDTQKESGGALQVFRQCIWATCSPMSTVCNMLSSALETDPCLDNETKNNILKNCVT